MIWTCLHSDTTITGQHADLLGLWRLGPHIIRLQIRSDFYEFQSHAFAQRWDGTRWHEIHRISAGGMRTPRGLSWHAGELPEAFDADVSALLAAVRLVLTGQAAPTSAAATQASVCTDSRACARRGCADCQRSYGPRT